MLYYLSMNKYKMDSYVHKRAMISYFKLFVGGIFVGSTVLNLAEFVTNVTGIDISSQIINYLPT